MNRRNDASECIIPNYRLRKNDLEAYLHVKFPSLWVQAREIDEYYIVDLPRKLSPDERSEIRRTLRLAEERYCTRSSMDSSRSASS